MSLLPLRRFRLRLTGLVLRAQCFGGFGPFLRTLRKRIDPQLSSTACGGVRDRTTHFGRSRRRCLRVRQCFAQEHEGKKQSESKIQRFIRSLPWGRA